MSKNRDRTVFKRSDGKQVNKRNDASRASSVHDTQKEAQMQARTHLANQGGEELAIKEVNRQIRSKDTIPPGNDPFPPRDSEH
jgi:hypothetical protein